MLKAWLGRCFDFAGLWELCFAPSSDLEKAGLPFKVNLERLSVNRTPLSGDAIRLVERARNRPVMPLPGQVIKMSPWYVT